MIAEAASSATFSACSDSTCSPMANVNGSLIPLFSNLNYDTMPSTHAEHPFDDNVDVLESTFWLCANSFCDASSAALEILTNNSHASDDHLFTAFESHAKITKEALNAIPVGALDALNPAEEKVRDAMSLLEAGNQYVSELREIRFEQEALHQNQMELVAEYRYLKREMWDAEVDITRNALCDLLEKQDQYEDIIKRYHFDWAAYERMFASNQVQNRLLNLKFAISTEYRVMITPAHPDMREIQELKTEADLCMDNISFLVPVLRVKKNVLDNREHASTQSSSKR